MLDSRAFIAAAFGPTDLNEWPSNEFFKVATDAGEEPDGEYYFIVIDNVHVPRRARLGGKVGRALFCYRAFDRPEKGGPIRVRVTALPPGFIGPTFVYPAMPIDQSDMKNGARLFIDLEKPRDPFPVGMRISSKGEVLFTPH